MPEPLFSVSTFAGRGDADPLALEPRSWDALRGALFAGHAEQLAKDGPAFSPATFRPGGKRRAADAEQLSLAVLDVDKGRAAIAEVAARLEAEGIAFALYTTHSHRTEKPAFRVVLPLARPVPVAAWPAAWKRANALIGGAADEACKDPARLYYLPAVPPERRGEAVLLSRPGSFVDLLAGLHTAPAIAPVAEVRPPAPLGALPPVRDFTPSELVGLVPDLGRVYEGEPFAQGERDAGVHGAVSLLVWTVPAASEASVLRFFAGTLAAMERANPADPIGPEKVLESYRRARAALASARATEAQASDSLRRMISRTAGLDPILGTLQRLAAARPPSDSDAEPTAPDPEVQEAPPEQLTATYSPAELARLCELARCDLADLERRWLIQRGTGFYVLTLEGYKRPVVLAELTQALREDLARAPVNLVSFDKNLNPRPRDVKLILAEHATVARNAVASLTAQASTFDARSETFTEATCPIRPIRPRFDAQIQAWLEALGGVHRERLLDWVATITQLDRPTCALYFAGPKSSGKTLFAHGLARLWTQGAPTSAAQALTGAFNGSIAACPLIFADEALPKKIGARTTSAELRELIGSTARPLTRKYLADSTLQGAVRLVLAANNDRLLDLREDLDTHDQAAVAERFLVLHVPDDAARYLEAIGGRAATDRWVDGDQIAAHALWLRDNRQVTRGGRWLVQGVAEEVHERLAVSSGAAGSVVEWLARAIANPKIIAGVVIDASTKAPGLVIGDGAILVNPTFVADFFDLYVKSDRPPSLHAIGRACRSLSLDGSRTRVSLGPAGERDSLRVWFWSLRPETILSWAEDNLVGDPEVMRGRVMQATEGAT